MRGTALRAFLGSGRKPAYPLQEPYRSVVLGDSPVAYWRLGESAGATASDETGNGHDGTYQGSPSLGVAGLLNGDADTAIQLNGSSQYVSLPTFSAFTAISVELWVKLDTTSTEQRAVALNNQAPYISLRLNSGGTAGLVEVLINTSGGAVTASATGYDLTVAHHIVATASQGGDLVLYIDGTEVDRTATAGTFTTTAAAGNRIGSSRSGSHCTDGVVDEVAIYAAALSAERVSAHYSAGS